MKRLAARTGLLAARPAPQRRHAPSDPTIATVEHRASCGRCRPRASSPSRAFPTPPRPSATCAGSRRPPAAKWQGVRDAHAVWRHLHAENAEPRQRHRPASRQRRLPHAQRLHAGPRRERKRPVMVWIHGGGFVNGSGSAELYDGSELAKRGVVRRHDQLSPRPLRIVRASAADARGGRRPHRQLRHDGHDRLARMGEAQHRAPSAGDASNVTIFGESAGGMAVQKLMTIAARARPVPQGRRAIRRRPRERAAISTSRMRAAFPRRNPMARPSSNR